MWQFAQAVEGIGEACRALSVPITGGNVSLYNETDGKAIYPTPVIGIVGLLEHADLVVGTCFRESGDAIILLGEGHGELGGSEYLRLVYDQIRGAAPVLDLDVERRLQALLVALAGERLVRSASDCSDGGLAAALAECCFAGSGLGADVSLGGTAVTGRRDLDEAAALFGESASRVLVSVTPDEVTAVLARAAAAAVPARVIGQTGGNRLRIAVAGRVAVDVAIEDAERVWSKAIDSYFEKQIA
jgi:phosphoribosylformylglycinamidine synthase